jgi:CBS-domain-containing membrane protein
LNRRGPATPPSHAVYAVLVSTVVMAVIGALGLWAGEAWFFPSLGPTIFLQAVTPDQPGARAWNTLVGHTIGVAAGFAAVYLVGANHAPPSMSADMLTASRVAATALAVGATIGLQYPLRALHPPAAATTMLITLGGFKPGLHTVWLIAAGVALVTLLGESARRLHPSQRGRSQAPRTADAMRSADG